MEPKVSIIICTRDRAVSLAQTLEAMRHLEVSADLPTELLVVDNGSADDTRRVAEALPLTNVSVRYINEPRRGLCYARNRGLAESVGEVIIFTDDDVRPSPDWIGRMCRPILADEVDALTGRVTLAPDRLRPWMTRSHRVGFASTEHLSAGNPHSLVGANMAFHRRVLHRVPGFDAELGSGGLGYGDDTFFGCQLREAGFRLGFSEEAAVEHHFDPARLSRANMLDMARKAGRSAAYIAHHWNHEEVAAPAWRLARAVARLAYRRLRAGPRLRGLDYAPDWEVALLGDVHFFRQYLRERRRKRNYALHGLVKLGDAPRQPRIAEVATARQVQGPAPRNVQPRLGEPR